MDPVSVDCDVADRVDVRREGVEGAAFTTVTGLDDFAGVITVERVLLTGTSTTTADVSSVDEAVRRVDLGETSSSLEGSTTLFDDFLVRFGTSAVIAGDAEATEERRVVLEGVVVTDFGGDDSTASVSFEVSTPLFCFSRIGESWVTEREALTRLPGVRGKGEAEGPERSTVLSFGVSIFLERLAGVSVLDRPLLSVSLVDEVVCLRVTASTATDGEEADFLVVLRD